MYRHLFKYYIASITISFIIYQILNILGARSMQRTILIVYIICVGMNYKNIFHDFERRKVVYINGRDRRFCNFVLNKHDRQTTKSVLQHCRTKVSLYKVCVIAQLHGIQGSGIVRLLQTAYTHLRISTVYGVTQMFQGSQ